MLYCAGGDAAGADLLRRSRPGVEGRDSEQASSPASRVVSAAGAARRPLYPALRRSTTVSSVAQSSSATGASAAAASATPAARRGARPRHPTGAARTRSRIVSATATASRPSAPVTRGARPVRIAAAKSISSCSIALVSTAGASLLHEQFLEQPLAQPLPVVVAQLADAKRRAAARRSAARRPSPAASQSRSTRTASP